MATKRRRTNSRADLIAHVEVCDERYANIETRLSRMEKVMISAAGSSILLLIAGIATLALKLLH